MRMREPKIGFKPTPMFTVKARFSQDIEVASGIDRVRDFFGDIGNFAELMPGITQIHTDASGIRASARAGRNTGGWANASKILRRTRRRHT